jgi:heme exporter protein CcmD
MTHWLYMGGYWPFVWASYLLTAVVVVLNIGSARRAFHAAQAEARRRAAQRQGGAQARGES